MEELQIGKNEATRARILKVIEAVAVFGMNQKEAAAYTDMPYTTVQSLMQREDVKAYIKDMQDAQAKRLNVTREHVLQGYLDAIEHAKMTNEPAVMIRGWEAIAKMQGYNAPEKQLHDLPEDTKKLLEAFRNADDERLASFAGQGDLIELTSDDYKKASNE